MITYTYDLDITPGAMPLVINLKQYETGQKLKFNLKSRLGDLSMGTVTDCSVRGTKPDGNGYSVTASYTTNLVTVTVDAQMTAVAGKAPFELTLTESAGKTITATFWLDIQRAAFDKDTMPSTSEIRELVDIIDKSDELIDAANTIKDGNTEILLNLNKKVNTPTINRTPAYGTAGQLLATNGDGTTSWASVGLPTDAQVGQAVSDWLDDHPEATTTVQDGAITLAKLNAEVKEEYVPRQYELSAPNSQDYFLEKLNDTSLVLEPINLQTIRDCRLGGFQFRSSLKNHVVVDRCYFLDDASDPTINTPVFDFNSDNWVGSIKVIGCESYFRKYFIEADSKDMTDVYFHLCTIEGAKKFATMEQNAIIRIDSCYIGDQQSASANDAPYIEMSDNTKLIITNSQIGSDGKGGQPFIKCGSGCQVLIKDSNLIMTNQAEPYASKFINYGSVPFDGAVGCDFVLDNVTWNIIPKRVNYNHNAIALACRQDKWRPTSNTPVKNYMKNPFFLDTTAIPSEWVDVTVDSTSPFYGYYNPYGGHIYSCGNTTQTFKFNWEIPSEKVGQNFYFVVFLNAQIGSNSPYFEGKLNCTWVTQGIMTGANNMVAPGSLNDDNIYTPILNMYGKLNCTAPTGTIGFGRNGSNMYISGVAFVAEEDINKFPIYDNIYD